MKPIKTSSSRRQPEGASMPARVLVVEDDPVLAMAIEVALADAGVGQIDAVATSEQALTALRDHTPDAVVLDVHLADRDDGWAVAELLETMGPNGPRIVFSTGAPQDIPEHIAALGSVLEKPYDPDALVALLRSTQPGGLLSRLKNVLR